MNWYKGNIAEAVAESKIKNAIFVVFVEGKDEATQKLTGFINEISIRQKLESDDFVAIKIESSSQAYMQFASIYQAVPVPSIFFIGKSGAPLEIGTAVLTNAGELEEKINKVLATSGKSSTTATASSSLIAGEQQAAGSSAQQQKETSIPPAVDSDVVCKDGVCIKKPQEAYLAEAEKPAAAEDTETAEQRLAETRKLLEDKRKARVEEEKRQEKEAELRRREDGKNVQNLKEWQREQELKELKENIRRDRLEEQAARERIRAQIAADRAERANKNADLSTARSASPPPVAKPSVSNADAARIQFRFANGDTKMHTFSSQQKLQEIRQHVKVELLPGTGIREFTLATTYPKRILGTEHDEQTLASLELCPTSVILVIGKESAVSPTALLARGGGLFNMCSTLFFAILSPVFALFGYFRNMIGGAAGGGRNGGAAAAATGTQKRANEEDGAKHEAAKRRNLERFGAGGATTGSAAGSSNNSTDAKPYRRYTGNSNVHRLHDGKNSDDENATWNGNSTQQQ